MNEPIKAASGVMLAALCVASVCAQETPRTPSGRVDLSGVWFGGFQPSLGAVTDGESVCMASCEEIEGSEDVRMQFPPTERPTYKPEYLARVAELNENQVIEDPVLRCENPGLPRIGAPDKIVQTDSELVFLYDDVNGSFWRVIPVDGRGYREDLEPTFLGDALGRWEGGSLVVETVNFVDETWLTDDGAIHSDQLRVVERFSRDGDTLTYQVTVHDPVMLAEPWVKQPATLNPARFEIVESPPCRERSLPLMQDLSSHDNPR
ncbi:MAG TPA: hypothetical protein VKQ06_05930 [Gammaproteobacteria bacterium]|nr:hypothetical protein [Gammaproteobacteria bacterium]